MEEKNRLEREIRSLKRRIDELEKESQGHKAEIDHRVQEERKKSELAIEHVKSDIQNFRLEADEALAALRRENAMKMAEYESKLSSANDNRMSSMFQVNCWFSIQQTFGLEVRITLRAQKGWPQFADSNEANGSRDQNVHKV